jgi:hypothetical protein
MKGLVTFYFMAEVWKENKNACKFSRESTIRQEHNKIPRIDRRKPIIFEYHNLHVIQFDWRLDLTTCTAGLYGLLQQIIKEIQCI